MRALFRSAALAALATSCTALSELPFWARGGTLWTSITAAQGSLGRQPASSARWIELPVDHFDLQSHAIFRCRYFIDDSGWAGSVRPAALFFVMGGEGPATGAGGGYVGQLAATHRARVVAIEHRGYGESVPGGMPNATNPGGLSLSHLRFVTSEQSLADAAALLDALNPNMAVPAFTFGGSCTRARSNPDARITLTESNAVRAHHAFPTLSPTHCAPAARPQNDADSGALSAWFRLKYPTRTRGSLSSSGVVNTIFDFVGFDEQVCPTLDRLEPIGR